MRKLTIALVAALVVAMALPVMAAPKVQVNGSLESKLTLSDQESFKGTGDLRLNLGISFDEGDRIKAFIGFKPVEWAPFWKPESGQQGAPLQSGDKPAAGTLGSLTPVTVLGPNGLTIEKAYVQAVGPYLPGGQEVTTRLGDLTLDYSPYILAASETDAVIEGASVDGIKLGPATVNVFYGWDPGTREPINPSGMAQDDEDFKHEVGSGLPETNGTRFVASGASFAANVEGFDVKGAMVNANDKLAYVGSLAFSPIQAISLSGVYAHDEASNASATKVEAALDANSMIPGLGVKVGYRNFDAAFNPIYRDRSVDDDGVATNVVGANVGQKGVKAEATMDIQGVTLTGSVDKYEQAPVDVVYERPEGDKTVYGVKAETMFEGFKLKGGYELAQGAIHQGDPDELTTITFGAERALPVGPLSVDAKYDLTMKSNAPAEHKVEASTTVPVPILNAVELTGKAKVQGDDRSYLGSVAYTAPNGIKFAVNYDKGYDDDIVDGLSATAGLKIEF
ncbi:MAG: hypothetical protein HPY71_10875 [Firmicutes bacterium]|nr:hypothetical protein [Bacillota bacterium]